MDWQRWSVRCEQRRVHAIGDHVHSIRIHTALHIEIPYERIFSIFRGTSISFQ